MTFWILVFIPLQSLLGTCEQSSEIKIDLLQPLTSETTNQIWLNFKNIYKKKYDDMSEDIKRKEILARKVKLIYEHNKRFESSLEDFSIQLNELSDLTLDEIIQKKTGFKDTKISLEPNSVNSTEFNSKSKKRRKRSLITANNIKNINIHIDKKHKKHMKHIHKKNHKIIITSTENIKSTQINSSNVMSSPSEKTTLPLNRKLNDSDNKLNTTYKGSISSTTTNLPFLFTVKVNGNNTAVKNPFSGITLGAELVTPQTVVELNWTALGHVSPVEDQRNCASCWAFAAAGALESQYSIVYKRSISFSKQFLIDCDYYNYGCSGGNPYVALYFTTLYGIARSRDYPYQSIQNNCQYKSEMPLYPCYGFDYDNYYLNGNETALKELVKMGPVAAAIEVTELYSLYKSGIFFDSTCTGKLNHAVLVTGYGTERGVDYWIVKNTWGPRFGEYGYIRMARNKNNNCGIAQYGAVPIV